MASINPFSTFNDKKLLKYLQKHDIKYNIDAQGMIDILPEKDGYRPAIVTDDRNVKLKSLRSSGSIITLGRKVECDALEAVHGSFRARFAQTMSANKLEIVTGQFDLSAMSPKALAKFYQLDN